MVNLVVIVPSRGRPQAAVELIESFRDTCTAHTALALAVDGDDPTRDDYAAIRVAGGQGFAGLTTQPQAGGNMVTALNHAAAVHATRGDGPPFAIGFMGDDHRPRTKGWDQRYLEVLRELGTGIVYGDDMLQSQNLPTQCAMTSDIIRELGYMAPPGLTHLMVDNFWRDLGTDAGCLRYLPDVVVEHLHPVAGKADWDEGHARVNTPAMYATDRTAYLRFRAEGHYTRAVAKVQALRSRA